MLDPLFAFLPEWFWIVHLTLVAAGAALALSNLRNAAADMRAAPAWLSQSAVYSYRGSAVLLLAHALHAALALWHPAPRVISALVYATLFLLALNGYMWRRSVNRRLA